MGDENPIHTLGDYSKPCHEGYRNTIELPIGNNMASNYLERLPTGSITTWEDLTTRFLAQFFPPGRTAKLRNDILSNFFMIMSPFFLNARLTAPPAANSANWEIIENLALYDHEGWNDTREFVKPVKAISTPQSTLKTHDRRLLELEDQINFLLNGSRPTTRPSSTNIPQAYAKAVYSNPRPQNQFEAPKQNPFTFRERTGPNPQPQALGTTFEARVRDYMAAHTKRIERFKNAIFKQREEINDRMTEMFRLLKELTTSKTPEKVLIREEAKFPVTKNINSISLARREEEMSDKIDVATGNDIEKTTRTETRMQANESEKKNEAGKEE
ncbi:zinc finger, CCHC-type containing protein [Tanacetum coccineum]